MKIIKLFVFIIGLLFVQSCLPSVELNERAIVEAVGIDKINGEFVVSVEYYDPDANNPENLQTAFIKASENSISLAISEINSKINKQLYFGHNNIIVVGKDAAKKDINSILEFFDFEPQTKSDICVFIADNAEQIVGLNDEKVKISPLSILQIVEKSLETGIGCEYRLFKIIGKTDFFLPFGEITDDLHFKVSGSCHFINGIMVTE